MEHFIQLACHVLTGPTSTRQSVAVWALSMITTEATNREPQRVVTGATAAITATDHITAYPGGGASKQIMVAIATFGTARPPKLHENRRIDPKHRRYDQDLDSCTAVDAGRRSHVLSPAFVTRTLCSILGLFRYKPEWYVVSDRTQTLIFLSNPIKYNWSRFLFERSEFLIDTPHKKNLRVCPRARVK